jgi:hypothetical protein
MTDEFVRRTGKIFTCGDFPDKGFSLNEQEARAAVDAFKPVFVDLEHTSTVLDSRLGTLESVAMHADGTSLVGTVALPRWLDDLLDDGTRKVSATWDKATKQLRGLAIVNSPRIADAALFAAFSATDEGQRLVEIESEFAGKRHSQADQDRLNAIAEHAVALGADYPSKGQAKMSKEHDMDDAKKIGVFDTLKALFVGGDIAVPPVAAIPPAGAKEQVPMSTTTPTTAEFAAMQAELQALKEGSARDTAGRIAAEAAHFAQDMLTARRITPAMKPAVEALFARALTDDAQDGATVTFARTDGEKVEGDRAAVLRAVFAASPEHKWLGEAVPKGDLIVLSNDGDKPADPLADAVASAQLYAKKTNGTT